MSTPTRRNAPGRVLGGRYVLLAPIAQGGMGEVWKARDRETGRLVAAKVLRPELFGEETSLSRLRLEAHNAMRVQHPNIAAVLDSGEDEGRGWIVMELVEGRPLTDFLRGGARLCVADLVPLLVQVAMALGAAQSAGVVHRDIKPANILVRPDGRVKLTDFGISRTASQAPMTAAGMVMGTAQYLAPEQAMGETATSAGDLYALGVIAYEAVTGARPFTGATQVDIAFSHVNDQVPPLPADVPTPFANVVLHLLEKNPANRPESGTALVRELVACAHTLGIGFAPRPLPTPTQEAPAPRTAVQPVVAPVEHTPRRTLPEELLAPVLLDEDVTSTRGGTPPRGAGRPAHAAPTTADHAPHPGTREGGHDVSPDGVDGAHPQEVHRPETAPVDEKARMREELSTRLRLRAAAREQLDAPRQGSGHAGAEAPRTPAPGRRSRPVVEDRPAAAPGDRRALPPSSPVTRRPLRSRGGAPASSPASPPWHALATHTTAPTPGARVRPTRTRYNRSVVAPPVPFKEQVGRWVVIALIVVTLILIAVATIHNRFGSLTSILGSGAHVIEEVRTWSTPWPTV